MKKNAAQLELDTIKNLHNQDLIVGFADSGKVDESTISVDYFVENRGRYGYVPSIYIHGIEKSQCEGVYISNDIPLSIMTPDAAYKYIRKGSSIRAARDFMNHLGWD